MLKKRLSVMAAFHLANQDCLLHGSESLLRPAVDEEGTRTGGLFSTNIYPITDLSNRILLKQRNLYAGIKLVLERVTTKISRYENTIP